MPLNMTYLQKLPGPKDLVWALSTVFGLGFFTSMPGTLGSVAGFFIYALFPLSISVIVLVALAGVWASGRYSRRRGVSDPKEVVIDEVVGMWVSMWGLSPGLYIPALFLFRILDILKPFPINAFEKLPGGWGVMADDIAAGVAVNLLLQLIGWLYFAGGWSFLF